MIRLYQILKLNDFIWFKNIYKKTNLKRTISKFKDLEYAKESIRLKKRFIYFQEILKISSLVYCTHNKIKNDLNKFYSIKSYLIFPLLKKIEKKKLNKKIKFSGFLTKYRMNVLKSLNIKFGRFNFFINNRDRNYSYSIHPKKNSSWIFSSPIRYIDAILFGEIPLTVGKFIDNYHNELSININVKNKKLIDFTEKKYSLDIKNINKKIVNYNKRIKNDDLESKIKLKNLI